MSRWVKSGNVCNVNKESSCFLSCLRFTLKRTEDVLLLGFFQVSLPECFWGVGVTLQLVLMCRTIMHQRTEIGSCLRSRVTVSLSQMMHTILANRVSACYLQNSANTPYLAEVRLLNHLEEYCPIALRNFTVSFSGTFVVCFE